MLYFRFIHHFDTFISDECFVLDCVFVFNVFVFVRSQG